MPVVSSPKEQAFNRLSMAAQLFVMAQANYSPKERFLFWVQCATNIENRKRCGNFTESSLQKIILGWIAEYLHAGNDPDARVDRCSTPLSYTFTYPKLAHFLLSKGADPNGIPNAYKSYFHSLASDFCIGISPAENLLLTAEILAAFGADSHSNEILKKINGSRTAAFAIQFTKVTSNPRPLSELPSLNENDFQHEGSLFLTEEDKQQIKYFYEKKYKVSTDAVIFPQRNLVILGNFAKLTTLAFLLVVNRTVINTQDKNDVAAKKNDDADSYENNNGNGRFIGMDKCAP